MSPPGSWNAATAADAEADAADVADRTVAAACLDTQCPMESWGEFATFRSADGRYDARLELQASDIADLDWRLVLRRRATAAGPVVQIFDAALWRDSKQGTMTSAAPHTMLAEPGWNGATMKSFVFSFEFGAACGNLEASWTIVRETGAKETGAAVLGRQGCSDVVP